MAERIFPDPRKNQRQVLELSTIAVLFLMVLLFRFWPFSKTSSAVFTGDDRLIEIADAIELPANEKEELPRKEENSTTSKVKGTKPVPANTVNKEIEVVVTPPKEKIKLESQDIDTGDLLTLDKQGKYKKNETNKKTTEKDPKAPKDNVYHTAVPYMPVPVGGYEAIQGKAVFPQSAKDAGVSGSVFITAFIDENGTVVSAVLTKGLHPACDNSALSAVRRTKFIPGKKDGKPVKAQMLIQVNFK